MITGYVQSHLNPSLNWSMLENKHLKRHYFLFLLLPVQRVDKLSTVRSTSAFMFLFGHKILQALLLTSYRKVQLHSVIIFKETGTQLSFL